MFGRRRPLLRGAAVGGAAYYAGKRRARNQASDEQAAADQEAENQKFEEYMAQNDANASTGSKGGESNSNFDELTKLQKLHENGILTDEEFADAKQKVIAKMG